MGEKKSCSYNGIQYDSIMAAAAANPHIKYSTLVRRIAANRHSSDEFVKSKKNKCKLSEAQVAWLRNSNRNDVTKLAIKFNVTTCTIRDATEGKRGYAKFNTKYPPRIISSKKKSNLSDEDFEYIREKQGTVLQTVLAERYGVSISYISKIWSGERGNKK